MGPSSSTGLARNSFTPERLQLFESLQSAEQLGRDRLISPPTQPQQLAVDTGKGVEKDISQDEKEYTWPGFPGDDSGHNG